MFTLFKLSRSITQNCAEQYIKNVMPARQIIIIQFKNHLAANYCPKETFAFLKANY